MKYQNPFIEPNEDTIAKYGGIKEYKRLHPEYHLYADLQERLPKYAKVIEKLNKIKLPTLNDKGLPF